MIYSWKSTLFIVSIAYTVLFSCEGRAIVTGYIGSSGGRELRHVIARLTREDRCFAAIEDWVLPAVVRYRALVWVMPRRKLTAFCRTNRAGRCPLPHTPRMPFCRHVY